LKLTDSRRSVKKKFETLYVKTGFTLGLEEKLFTALTHPICFSVFHHTVHYTGDPGARHLAGTGLKDAEVHATITQAIQKSIAGVLSIGEFWWGQVTVRGQDIIFHAYSISATRIHVGERKAKSTLGKKVKKN